MEFIDNLNNGLEEWFLLKHPFYQAWNKGDISVEALGVYAQEYYHHVSAFPRYISQIHALCSNIRWRQTLLANLVEEEQGDENHPELWMRFVEGISGSRDCGESPRLEQTKRLVDGFFDLTRLDYASGLGALYSYERQTAAVSCAKIDGLMTHYGITDPRTLKFFVVHSEVDEWHTEELVGLINDLDPASQRQLYEGAMHGAKLLWGFLDGMSEECNIQTH